jgi:Holliday junction resolvasome RuvABC endonuclease subunit
MNIVGIDPGLQGGIAVLDSLTNTVIATYKVPTKRVNKKLVIDTKELLNILESVCKNSTVVIEDVFIGKGMSCKSSITTISNWGIIIGLLRLIDIEPIIIGPSTWQSKMFKDVVIGQQQGDKVIKLSKIKSLQVAALLGYQGGLDGVADSCCIAYYYSKFILTLVN